MFYIRGYAYARVSHVCSDAMNHSTPQHNLIHLTTPGRACNVCEIFSLQTSYFSFLVCFEPYTKKWFKGLLIFNSFNVGLWLEMRKTMEIRFFFILCPFKANRNLHRPNTFVICPEAYVCIGNQTRVFGLTVNNHRNFFAFFFNSKFRLVH